jgi:beta-lactam-binding protein with PASTA domain
VVGVVTTVPGGEGVVVRTDPTPGEAVAAGTAVDLFVGNGVEG